MTGDPAVDVDVERITDDAYPGDYWLKLEAECPYDWWWRQQLSRLFGTGTKVVARKGPPGTGKTTFLVEASLELASAFGDFGRIGFMPFSNAAKRQALDELDRQCARAGKPRLTALEVRNVRTLHSAACALVRVDQSKLMTDQRRERFRREKFRSLSATEAKRYDTIVDRCLANGTPRASLVSEVTAAEAAHVDAGRLGRYYDAFVAYLRTKGLILFDDVLRLVLASKGTFNELVPDVSVLVVDEAQDLSPLAAAVVEFWAERCSTLLAAGDDDQAIFRWAGADARWFQGLVLAHDGSTLHQSHRVPKKVHAVAMNIITKVKGRLDTPYLPTDEEGEIIRGVSVEQLPRLLDGKRNLVLARDGWALVPVKSVLDRAGLKYIQLSGEAGRDDRDLHAATEAMVDLANGRPVKAADVLRLVRRRNRRDERELAGKLELAGGAPITTSTLQQWGECQLQGELANGPSVGAVGRLSKRQRATVEEALGLSTSPNITVSTIHAAKGLQADVVAIVPDRSLTSFQAEQQGKEAREDELRLAYVAVTRTRRKLVLLEPLEPGNAHRAFKWPRTPTAVQQPGPSTADGGIYT